MRTWIADDTQIYKCRLFFLNFNKFSRRYIANMIGAACNSRIPQANFHAVLKFDHEKNSKNSIHYIIHN